MNGMSQQSLGKRPFSQRFLLPVLIPLGLWIITELVVNGYAAAEVPPDIPRWLLNVLSGYRTLMLLFGALFVYPAMRLRGATAVERWIGSYAIVVAYAVLAMVRATAFFPVGEAIYYGFNPVTFGSAFLQLAWICVAEMGCRWWVRRSGGAAVVVFRWRFLAGILVGLAAIYIVLLWEGGVHGFYIYQEGYKLLFQ